MRCGGGWDGPPVRSAMDWPEMRTRYAWLPPHRGTTATGAHQIGVSFSAHESVARHVGRRTTRGAIRAGTTFVTGPDPIYWTDVAEPTEALEIYPGPSMLAGLADREPRVDPAAGGRDWVTFGLASIIKRAHVADRPLTDIEASTLAHRLVEHLGDRYYGTAEPKRVAKLAPRVVDRVGRYVDAHLAGPITLSGLAAQASLSPYHFARAFRATTGLPPHRFVNACRLERAKNALLHSPATVAEVAYAVGFSNVSHFRRLFRRELGVLPGQLRRDRKNGPSPGRPGLPGSPHDAAPVPVLQRGHLAGRQHPPGG